MLSRKWTIATIATTISIILLSSIPDPAIAQNPEKLQQCQDLPLQKLEEIAKKTRPTASAIALTTKKSPVLPSGEIVPAEIAEVVKLENKVFCAALLGAEQRVEVLTANRSNDRIEFTLKIPEIPGFYLWKNISLALASFSVDEVESGKWNQDDSDIFILQETKISCWLFALIGGILAASAAYLLAGITLFSLARRSGDNERNWFKYFNPFVITSGEFSRASLSNLQVFWFTLIVLGLLVHIFLRTGALSPLSNDILLLLGISAVGKIASTGVDVAKKRLSSDSRSKTILLRNVHWEDLISTDGSLDIYRFQLGVFSFLVGVILLISGRNVLETFSLPEGFALLLGLSNAVYILGKVVTPNSQGNANTDSNNIPQPERDLQQRDGRDLARATSEQELGDRNSTNQL